jgi:hypothetical protein
MTIQELLNKLKNYKANVSNIIYNDVTLYSDYMNENKKTENINKTIIELINKSCIINNSHVVNYKSYIIDVCINDMDNDEIDDMIMVEIIA